MRLGSPVGAVLLAGAAIESGCTGSAGGRHHVVRVAHHAGHGLVGLVVAADLAAVPVPADADAEGVGGALAAADRAPVVGAPVVGAAVVGAAVRVGLWVRVCVVVVVAAGLEVREVGEIDEVTVTVVGSPAGRGAGEAFPPLMDSPVPPDSGPPLTVSSNVTVAKLAAKTTTAAAAAASTTINGRRDRRGVGVGRRPVRGMTIVGSS